MSRKRWTCAEVGANVAILTPFDDVVFDRTLTRSDVKVAALWQVAADLLTSPGRGPNEAEALMNWMRQNHGARRACSAGLTVPDHCILIRRKMDSMTRIAVEVPEDIAKRLESAWHDVSRGALEAVALEGYRDGTLSREQIGRILGLSFGETEAFLKARQAYLAYDEEDFKSDLRGLRQLGSR